MKLRDRFNDLVPVEFGGMQEPLLTECERIADEYAIGFAEWLNNGRFSQFGDAWSNPRQTKYPSGDWLFYTSKQLLEMYKKEKGL